MADNVVAFLLHDDSPSLLTHLHGDQLATVVAQHVC
ncbi:hypothetical protein ECKD2_09009 [Escherichia coli KD2]|nr:hypothetical protein ECO7815_15788 [Escherichia coli O55:H7 str. 3256-97]EIL53573.1 hypothetical protein ECKD2_09009 [Escherichia coli KD2]EIL73321.1 hypothetical protein ECMT8_21315 [Escherichia coli CUMT8]EST84833.1 hypothetical protein ECC1470_10544 [Escherichia coli ECC-1470]